MQIKYQRKKRTIPVAHWCREEKKNHITVEIRAGKEADVERVVKKIKKVVRGENHLMEERLSFSIYCHVKDQNENE